MKSLLCFFWLALCALPFAACSSRALGDAPKDRLAVYYWAQTLYPERWAAMLELAPDDVFVKAGTIERGTGGLRHLPPVVRGIFPVPKGLRVHAVFHHRIQGRGEVEAVIEQLPGWIAAGQWALSRGGLTLSGIQLDLEGDFPVTEYPRLLSRLSLPDSYTRSVFVGAGQISNVECVAALDAFDRIAVGTYDSSWDLDRFRPVDIPYSVDFIRRMFLQNEQGANAAMRSRALADRIWLVAPIYGAVSVLDAQGRARIPFIDFSSPDIFRTHVKSDGKSSGRELLRVESKFSVKDVTLVPGERLAIHRPDLRRLGDELRAARKRIPGMHGMALFSWPVRTNWNPDDGEIRAMVQRLRR